MADESNENKRNAGGPPEAWKVTVWKAWCKGERNIAALARQADRDWHTTKRAIRTMSAIATRLDDGIDGLGEYIAGLEADLQDAERCFREYRDSNMASAAIGAKKLIRDIREKLAAARGVTTERKATEHSGEVGINWLEAIGEDGSEPTEDSE